MPHLTGDRLAEELMRIRPDIPVILCTGYSERISEQRARRIGVREFLMKPLVRQDMANAVRNVLDERQGS
jgi:FixJ family two-component response regulator